MGVDVLTIAADQPQLQRIDLQSKRIDSCRIAGPSDLIRAKVSRITLRRTRTSSRRSRITPRRLLIRPRRVLIAPTVPDRRDFVIIRGL